MLNASLESSKLLYVLSKLTVFRQGKTILIAGLVFLALASARADNLITNGNFSPTGLTFTNNAATINTGPNTNTTAAQGWSVTAVTGQGNYMAQQGTSNGDNWVPNPPTGSIYGTSAFSIQMDSASNTTVFQFVVHLLPLQGQAGSEGERETRIMACMAFAGSIGCMDCAIPGRHRMVVSAKRKI
jgi:hypothetical protein